MDKINGSADRSWWDGLVREMGLIDSADPKEAAKKYEEAAKGGHPLAQYSLALLFMKGLGVIKNEAKAFEWMRKASESGVTSAHFELGEMYYHGNGAVMDLNKAFESYEKAAAKNDKRALLAVARMYETGTGAAKNQAMADVYYAKAASVGETSIDVEVWLKELEEGFKRGGKAEEYRNAAESLDASAIEALKKLASGGDPEAYAVLGDAYYKNAKLADAVKYYEGASKYGDARVSYLLGVIFEKGESEISSDAKKAFDYYKKAADLGNSDAQLRLGDAFHEAELGIYVRNMERAFEYYQLAANQGNIEAIERLADMYEHGKGVAKNDDKAKELYEKAAKLRA